MKILKLLMRLLLDLCFAILIDNYGTDDESTLPRRRPKNSEFLDLDAKFGKSGIGEVKTLNSIEPTVLDCKEFNYDNCSLIDCIPCCNPLLILHMLIVKTKLLPNILLMPCCNILMKNLIGKFLYLENLMMSGNLL